MNEKQAPPNAPHPPKKNPHPNLGSDVDSNLIQLFIFFNSISFFKMNLFIYLIYLFLAVLGLRFCAQAFSSCGERGLLFVAVHGLLIGVASLVAEHGL